MGRGGKGGETSWVMPVPDASGIINPWEPLGAGEELLGDVWDKEKLQQHLWRLLVYRDVKSQQKGLQLGLIPPGRK